MVLRVIVWAVVGIGVACGWMYYGITTGAGQNIGAWTVVAITAPATLIGREIPLAYSTIAFINGAIYAVIGLLIETIWRLR